MSQLPRFTSRQVKLAIGGFADLPDVAGGRSAVVTCSRIDTTGGQYDDVWISIYGFVGEQRVLLAKQQLPPALDGAPDAVVVCRYSGGYWAAFSAQLFVSVGGRQPPQSIFQLSSDEMPSPVDGLATRINTGTIGVASGAPQKLIQPNPARRALQIQCITAGQVVTIGGSAADAPNGVQVPTVAAGLPNTYLLLESTGAVWGEATGASVLRWVEECID